MTAHWSWGTAPPASSELTALPLGLLAQDLNFWCAFETDEVRGMFDWESVVVKGPLELAALLSEKFGVPPWWTQMVTVGYEQAVGKRVRLQKADGFAVSASKTLSLPAAAAFKAFGDSRTQSAWLTDDLTIRKATAPKSLRITWKDGKSHVDVNIYAKGARKSQVSLQHTKLANARTATQMKK